MNVRYELIERELSVTGFDGCRFALGHRLRGVLSRVFPRPNADVTPPGWPKRPDDFRPGTRRRSRTSRRRRREELEWSGTRNEKQGPGSETPSAASTASPRRRRLGGAGGHRPGRAPVGDAPTLTPTTFVERAIAESSRLAGRTESRRRTGDGRSRRRNSRSPRGSRRATRSGRTRIRETSVRRKRSSSPRTTSRPRRRGGRTRDGRGGDDAVKSRRDDRSGVVRSLVPRARARRSTDRGLGPSPRQRPSPWGERRPPAG